MGPKTKTKSIWKDPTAQHFQVVHRSQRDPLINDQDAGTHVLKSFTPKHTLNQSSSTTTTTTDGNTLTDLQFELQKQGVKERPNIGQASLYGVYYDDTNYDYMQHLRPIGGSYNSQRGGKDEELDTTAILLEAPEKGKSKGRKAAGEKEQEMEKEKEFEMAGFKLKERKEPMKLPDEVLPNKKELTLEQSRRNQLNIDPSLQGLQPDMDPHLRQVLEALDDDAFDFKRAVKSLKKSETHQRSLKDRGLNQMETSKEEESQDQQEQEEEGDEELDFDDFLAGIIHEGEQDEEEEEPEWKALPPGGEESIWLDDTERALFKSKSKKNSTFSDSGDTETEIEIHIPQDESIPDVSSSSNGVEEVDDDGISLSARVALFKKAQKLEAAMKSQDPSKSKSRIAQSGILPSVAGSQTSIFSETKKKSRAGTKARLGASSMAGSQAGDGASAWSMSSSAMFRNEGLKGLDDRFDRVSKEDGRRWTLLFFLNKAMMLNKYRDSLLQ